MNGWTRVCLVLLRLAIGWHFLFEGLEKIHSVNVGPAEGNRPWTSKAYLREAVGPLAPYFRRQAGDTDEEALALLSVQPVPEGQDPSRIPPRQRIAPVLDQAWDEYFRRFKTHYGLDPEQEKLAQAKLEQAKDQAVLWLLNQEPLREVEKTYPSGTLKVKQAPAESVREYRQKVEELHDIENNKLLAFDRDVEKARLRQLKSDINRMRTQLLADLQKPLIDSLATVLTDEQKKKGPVTDLPEEKRPWYVKTRVEWIDWITRYGLTAVGACLLLGLFTRTACLAGAAFLLLFYLSMPPWPWVPENPRAEGHYLFINKNLIELLALLALATTRSGRWAGLDGLFQLLTPWGRRSLVRERERELEPAASTR